MAYNQIQLDVYREALTRGGGLKASEMAAYECPSCPYCNGSRESAVKHVHPSTKPKDPWEFWHHVVLDKYRKLHSAAAARNTEKTFTDPSHVGVSRGGRERAFAVGPMVDQSELPFRLLCRQRGATLTYTPMLHAKSFAESATYRRQFLSLTPVDDVLQAVATQRKSAAVDDAAVLVDRPVIVQLCGSNADTVLQAARYAVRGDDGEGPAALDGEAYYRCDAVDLNLGCPQGIARRGHYGSFLMEEWDIIHTIIHTLHVELEVPVTAKMRVFDTADGELDEALTVAYAKMLRDAGAAAICIHGRTRAMKGQNSGLADMNFIRRIRDALEGTVPVLSNGNVLNFADVEAHLTAIGAEGHMCAEPLLWDPALFADPPHPVPSGRLDCIAGKPARLAGLANAAAYLQWVQRCPVSLGFAKAHLFKMMYHSYELHSEWREKLSALTVSATPASPPAVFATDLQLLVEHVAGLRAVEEASDAVLPQEKAKLHTARGCEKTEQTQAPHNWFQDSDEPLGFNFGQARNKHTKNGFLLDSSPPSTSICTICTLHIPQYAFPFPFLLFAASSPCSPLHLLEGPDLSWIADHLYFSPPFSFQKEHTEREKACRTSTLSFLLRKHPILLVWESSPLFDSGAPHIARLLQAMDSKPDSNAPEESTKRTGSASGEAVASSSSSSYSSDDDFKDIEEQDSMSTPETMVEIQVYASATMSPPGTSQGRTRAEWSASSLSTRRESLTSPSTPMKSEQQDAPPQALRAAEDEEAAGKQPAEEPGLEVLWATEYEEAVPKQPVEEPGLEALRGTTEYEEAVPKQPAEEPGLEVLWATEYEEAVPKQPVEEPGLEALRGATEYEEAVPKQPAEEPGLEALRVTQDKEAAENEYTNDFHHDAVVEPNGERSLYSPVSESRSGASKEAEFNEVFSDSSRPGTQAADFNQTIWKTRADSDVAEHFPTPRDKSVQVGKNTVSRAMHMLPPVAAAAQQKKPVAAAAESTAAAEDEDQLPDLHGKSGVNVVDNRTRSNASRSRSFSSSYSYSSWSSCSISAPEVERREKAKGSSSRDRDHSEAVTRLPALRKKRSKTGGKRKAKPKRPAKEEEEGGGRIHPYQPQPPSEGRPSNNGRNPRGRSTHTMKKQPRTKTAKELESESLRVMPNSPYLQPVFPHRNQSPQNSARGAGGNELSPQRRPSKGGGKRVDDGPSGKGSEAQQPGKDDPYAYLLGRHGFWGENKYLYDQKSCAPTPMTAQHRSPTSPNTLLRGDSRLEKARRCDPFRNKRDTPRRKCLVHCRRGRCMYETYGPSRMT
eukprot:gene9694-6791_t